MVSENQWRAIAIVLAVVLLLAAFMTGLTGIADGISPVGDVREDYASFKRSLTRSAITKKRSPTARPNTMRKRPLMTSRKPLMTKSTSNTRRQIKNTTRMF